MNTTIISCSTPIWLSMIVSGIIVIALSRTKLLKEPVNDGSGKYKYSFSKSQLVWWLWIIFSCFGGYYFCTNEIPVPNATILWVLGISGATTAVAMGTDMMNASNNVWRKVMVVEKRKILVTFLKEILSDANGLSIYRLQALLFNLLYGVIFLSTVIHNLEVSPQNATVFPDFDSNIRYLLIISNGTYAVLRTTETK